jgi:hypothetical protein
VAVSNVIYGPSDSDNAPNGFSAIPPDNALAVSTTDVLMAENDVIEITDRSGNALLGPEPLSKFFSSVDNGYFLTDPRALVDPVTGNFIVTCDALTTNSSGAVTGSAVLYGISNGPDPMTPGWKASSTRLMRSTVSRPGPTSPQSPRTDTPWMSPARSLASPQADTSIAPSRSSRSLAGHRPPTISETLHGGPRNGRDSAFVDHVPWLEPVPRTAM